MGGRARGGAKAVSGNEEAVLNADLPQLCIPIRAYILPGSIWIDSNILKCLVAVKKQCRPSPLLTRSMLTIAHITEIL